MLSAFSQLKIGTRIYAGFAVVLALLIAVAAVGQLGLATVQGTVGSYDTVARNATGVALIDSAFAQLRRTVLAYTATGAEAAIEEARTREAAIEAKGKDILAGLTDEEQRETMRKLLAGVGRYLKNFEDIQKSRNEYNRQVREVMRPAGAAIQDALAAIIRAALDENDPDLAARAGLALEQLLGAAVNVNLYFAEGQKSDLQAGRTHLEKLVPMIADLDVGSLVQDRQERIRLAGEAATRYAAAVAAADQALEEMNRVAGEVNTRLANQIGRSTNDLVASQFAALDEMREASAATADETRILAIAVSAAALLVGIAAAALIALGITRPIRAMTAVMARLADRDFATEVPAQDRGDEIGAMAKAVQVFKDSGIENERLQQEAEAARAREAEQAEERRRLEAEARIAEERRQREAEEAKRRSEAAEREAEARRRAEDERRKEAAEAERRAEMNRLAESFEASVKSVVETVSQSAGDMQTSAVTLSATAEETSRQAAAVAAASEEATTNVQTVASAAEELSASIGEINRQVSESVKTAQDAVAQARATGTTVDGLAQAASKIGEVVNLITDIASQTNLLALNATIEAARAGEAGKGFAVVASEVKSLANQTAKATEEISRQIGAVQGATHEAVEAIRQIGASIERVSDIAATIATAVEQQGSATQEISRNVQQAASGTQDVSKNIGSVTQAAGEVGTAAGQLNQASTALTAQADTLRAEVDRFIARVRAA